VTLHQLDAHPIRFSPARIFACENPAVLRRACAELGPACPPLLARKASRRGFHTLARIAVAAGSELAYHGDFDWRACHHARSSTARRAAWRMTAGDYLAGVKAGDTAIAF